MNRKRQTSFFKRSQLLLTALGGLGLLSSSLLGQTPPRPVPVLEDRPAANVNGAVGSVSEQSEGVEHLTRGPLHEAFAEPYQADPQPSPVVRKQPPEAVNEVPPEYRPDGDNVVWISGYWSWDDDRTDFIWVSGVWRDVPPDHQWVPGYWSQTSGGFQYVSGFWASDQVSELEYLPPPPASLEQGPSSPAPGDTYFYIPGHWVYNGNDYMWQPGYWSVNQENWVWTPDSYVWTPRGCIYQAGYWDYDIPYRGVAFTPVYYQQPVYRNPQYVYRPRYVVETGLGLFVHMFVRPNYGQYYFGDYYGQRYSNSHQPWATYYQGPRYYDPFYTNYRVRRQVGSNVNLLSWIVNQHQVFAQNDRYRPAATIAAQRDFRNDISNSNLDQTILRLANIGVSLDSVVAGRESNNDFVKLNPGDFDRISRSIAPLRELGNRRSQVESGQFANADVKANTNANTNVNTKANANSNANVGLSLSEIRRQTAKANVAAELKKDTNSDGRRGGRTDLSARGQFNQEENIPRSKDGKQPSADRPALGKQTPNDPGLNTPNRSAPDLRKREGRIDNLPLGSAERLNPSDTSKRKATIPKNQDGTKNPEAASQLLPARPENWPVIPRRERGQRVPELPQSQPPTNPPALGKSRGKSAAERQLPPRLAIPPQSNTVPKPSGDRAAPDLDKGSQSKAASNPVIPTLKASGGKKEGGGDSNGKGNKKDK